MFRQVRRCGGPSPVAFRCLSTYILVNSLTMTCSVSTFPTTGRLTTGWSLSQIVTNLAAIH